jgi:4-amino-4-deoxy-L-arabinose transferase-like glycosyltransferase
MLSPLFEKNEKTILIGIIVLSVLLRVGAAVYLGNQVVEMPGTADQISYHTLALRVVDGYGFTFAEPWWPMTPAGAPTAHWSYLYTGFLAFLYALFGENPIAARVLQAVIVGILQPYLAYLLGKRIFNVAVGLLAAGLTGIYLYFVYYSAALMTEAFYFTAILGCLYLAIALSDRLFIDSSKRMDRKAIQISLGLGVVLGVVILLRQVFMLFVPFIFLWIWWRAKRRFWPRVILPLLFSGLIAILMILPFTLFNYTQFDRFVLLNTNAGYAFYLANHPIYGTQFEPILPPEMGSYKDLVPIELRRIGDEALLEKELLGRGIQFVLDDPGRYILLSISRIPPYIMFWPSAGSGLISNISRVFGFGLLLPFMLYGLVRTFFRVPPSKGVSLKSPSFLLMLFILVYSGVHILTWTLVRYRLPVDAVLMVFAALAIYDLVERLVKLVRPSPISQTTA